ncbi:hypothetical protein ILUMI_02289 [Ignelater luminosus]|uniref:Tc1-like transposase DDE domain-containing protein n=1 Tax=Ignelater luminosus TaxID=2038154 RepID=A0A8K0DHY2_IGNLU|nr:hypothetical protein ILUMI_02289 [Ignelater luminosus]
MKHFPPRWMVRNYKGETNRANINEDTMHHALQQANLAIVNQKTLLRITKVEEYLQHFDDDGYDSEQEEIGSKYATRKVFSSSQEDIVLKYIKKCSNMNYGMTYEQIRVWLMSYDYAKIIPDCKYPERWDLQKKAGVDWLHGFMKRNSTLSLRKPESASLARELARVSVHGKYRKKLTEREKRDSATKQDSESESETETDNECVVGTVEHGGGSLMVWGCFGNNKTEDLHRIEGTLKKERYKKILENHALPSGRRLIGRGFIFQQHNDPKHSFKLCKSFLSEKKRRREIVVLTWPLQSPDLNAIELLWEELDSKVRKNFPKSDNRLWELLQATWQEIDTKILDKLINCMPKLCNAIIKNKGGFIDETKI